MGQAFRKLFDAFFGNSEMRVRDIFLIISPVCFCIYPFSLSLLIIPFFFWNFWLSFFFFVFVVCYGLFPLLTNFVWQKFSDSWFGHLNTMILPLPFWIWVPILMFQFQAFFVLTNIGEFHLIISFLPAYLPLLFSSLSIPNGYLWLTLPHNFWHVP